MRDEFNQLFLKNKLLSGLQSDLFAVLVPHLREIVLEQGHVIETPNNKISHVYFPGPGVISVVSSTQGSVRLETGLIGPEGMTGLPLLYDIESAPHETFVQIPCRAMRIGASDFRKALADSRPLHYHLLRYAYAFSVQVAQTALCNGRFTISQRLARWLLMSHDRIDREDIPLTHEFLAVMLGIRRAGVTTALNYFVHQQAILIQRGTITIRDRDVLLTSAGNAYGLPEAQYATIMQIEAHQPAA